MKTLVVLSHLRWDFVFQRPQHLLTRLSKYYNIIFVEEPMKGPVALDVHHISPSIQVVVPHTGVEEFGFSDAQMEVIGPMLHSWLRGEVQSGYGLWFYTPQALPLKDYLSDYEFIVFDVMDELSMFANAPIQLKEREAELLKIADLVTAGGPSLARAKQLVRPDTLSLPSSVDGTHFAPKTAEEREADNHFEDRLEHDIAHPRLGFFGVIDERLDTDLIAYIADADPRWQLVMVGPVVKIDPETLPKRANIHWLGQQDYAVLPQLVHEWEVCMLPFALNDATKFISPTKTLEYLAAEKPVVSTAVHDVVELYGDAVEIAYDKDEFVAKLHDVMNESEVAKAERLFLTREVVKANEWDATAEKFHQAIEQVISSKPSYAYISAP